MSETTQTTAKKTASLRAIAAGIPPLPKNLTTLLTLDAGDLEAARGLIASEPAMVTEVVRLRNSSLFAAAAPVSSFDEALSYLGVDRATNALLTVMIPRIFDGRVEVIRPLVDRATLVAALARLVATIEGQPSNEAEQAFTDGLLHDLGRLALAHAVPEVTPPLDAGKSALWEFEVENYGTTHEQAGGLLGRQWELPHDLTVVMARHGEAGATDLPTEVRPRLWRLEVANALAPIVSASDAYASANDAARDLLDDAPVSTCLELLRLDAPLVLRALETAWNELMRYRRLDAPTTS